MPESIIVNGSRQYRSGIPGKIDASALGGKGTSTGNVAIIGQLPTFEHDEVHVFTDAASLQSFDPSDPELGLLGKLAFNPSQQAGIGGVDRLYVVNAKTNTQAGVTIQDATPKDALTILSNVWGPAGNRLAYELEVKATGLSDLTLTRNGISESYEDLGAAEIAEIGLYTGTLNESYLTLSPTEHRINWGVDFTFIAGVMTVPGASITEMVTDNKAITLEPVSNPSSPTTLNDLTVTIDGTDETGAVAQEILTWVAGAAPSEQTTTTLWSSFTGIAGATADITYISDIEIGGVALSADPTELNSFADFIDQVNDLGNGWSATAIDPRISTIPAEDVDAIGGLALDSSARSVDAHLWAVLKGLENSALTTVSRATGGDRMPATATYSGTLIGGTVTTIALADWTAALQELLQEDVQWVVPLSDDIDVIKAVNAHCNEAASYEHERSAWVGATTNQTLANLFANFTAKINSSNVGLVGYDIKVTHPVLSREVQLAPYYGALQACAMMAGTAVATPLLRKRPDINDAVMNWRHTLDVDTAISYGITCLVKDRLGWKFERGVTTYLTDDNPILSESSAIESAKVSVRTLRDALDGNIGNPATDLTANGLKGVVEGLLDRQIASPGRIIKDWRNVVIQDGGSYFSIGYEAAVIEPLNWMPVTLNVVRIPTTA